MIILSMDVHFNVMVQVIKGKEIKSLKHPKSIESNSRSKKGSAMKNY